MEKISQEKIRQGDMILVAYPFSDSTASKIRPAIIVSNNAFNQQSIDYLCVPITSVLKQVPYSITLRQNQLSIGKIFVESRIRVDKLTAIAKSKIIRKIGTVNTATFNAVKKELLTLF